MEDIVGVKEARELEMIARGQDRVLLAHLFIFMIALFLVGCGGGGDGGGGTPTPIAPTELAEDIFPDPGLVVHVEVGQEAILNGSGSTTSAEGELVYAWSFTHKPDGSDAVLQNATTVTPSFLADVRGTYMVQLVVSVGGVASKPVIGSVEATNDYSPDIPRPDHTRSTSIKFSAQCINCHIGGPGEVVGKSPDHIDSSNLCQACHSIFGFAIIPYVDHEQVFGVCSSCHNGVSALGKSDQHVQTTAECDECHSTTSFLFIAPDGSYDHSEISSGCERCHNAVLAIGMDDDHIDTLSDCVMCHTTDAFKPAAFDHSSYTDNCARSGCHTGLPGDALGQPTVHPDTFTLNIDCNVCHNVKAFTHGNTFEHAVIISTELACKACHDGSNAVATVKIQNHIGTSADCGSCHNTNGFTPAFIDHTSTTVTSVTCASCHNNGTNSAAPGLSTNHMPTTEDCGSCHTPGTFTSGVFDHVVNTLPITTNCVSCHDEVITAGKPVIHIPTSEDCSVCHMTNTFAGVVFNHAGIDTNNCALCHDGQISIGKDRYHLPTSEDCSLCHGTDYSSFATGAFHTNVDVTSNCASCHNRVIATGKSRTTHIPTLDDCSVCHDISSAFQPSKFYTDVHVNITTDCVECHNGEFTTPNVTVRGKSPDHMATSNLCETCHTISAFTPVPSVDHQQVFGICSECHNGVIAIGKADQHVPTNGECDACHTSTTSFPLVDLNGSYDHVGVSSACARCHDGVLAMGKDVGHVLTTSECNVCHTTVAFKPANFDHSTITESCAFCHNGGTTTGQPLGHPDTNAVNIDCGVCHNTEVFSLGNVFNHALVISSDLACASCHDGVNTVAKVKPLSHPALNQPEPDCGMCHTTKVFKPAVIDHSTLMDNCARSGCHDKSNPTIKSMHANHLPTAVDCVVCHTPGTFTSGTFDHSQANTTIDPITGNCTSCHNDVIVSGLPVNHMPTTAECDACHNTTNFTAAVFTHVGINTSSCADCHDGNTSLGKDQNHLLTTDDCSVCHGTTDFTTFTTGNFHNNVAVTTDCANCHDTVIATGKPELTHIPAQDDCSVCHDVSSVFKPSKFYTNVHVDITRGCEGCHNGQFTTSNGPVAAKAVNHVPTSQDCDVCHTVTAFTPSTFAHVGITSACVSCHDGNYTAVRALGLSPTHIPTSEDCGACHNFTNQAFKPAFVDHTSSAVTSVTCVSCHYGSGTGGATGKADKPVGIHVQTSQDCGVCHVPGGSFVPAVFDHNNLPLNTRCDSCHGVSAKGKDAKVNPVHVQTTEDCKVCHNTTAFAGAKYNHEGIVDDCASCHGDTAVGKPTYHVPTNDDCSVCHVTTGFIPGTFDHVGIVDNCASCHDGVFATGKNDVINHPTTDSDCGVCHSITGQFLDGQMDHTGIVDNCARAGCHGNGATGKDVNHLDTSEDCSVCHGTDTSSFATGAFHTNVDVTANCASCHNQVIATGKSTLTHIPTQDDCIVCHDVSSAFQPSKFYTDVHVNITTDCVNCHNGQFTTPNVTVTGKSPDHMATSNLCEACHLISAFTPVPSVDHQHVFGKCSECHNGVFAIGKSDQHVPTNGECDACHTSTTSFLFVDLNGNYDHTGISSDCSRCHDGVLAMGKDVGHVLTISECNVCHTTVAFIPATFDHSTITESCAFCHDGGTATGQPLGHPDTNAVNIDCDHCHNTEVFSLGNVFNHSLIISSDLACASCHDGADAVARVKPLSHPALNQPEPDCGMCHTTEVFKPAVIDHSTLTDNCARSGCHDKSNPTIKSMHANHLPTAVDCVVCHTPGTFTSGTFNHSQANTTIDPITGNCTSCHNDIIVSGLPVNHIPIIAECDACHNTTNFTDAVFTHVGIDVNNCAQCHDGNISFGKDQNHLPTTDDCSVCHSTTDFTTFTTGNFHNNVAVTTDCANCHDTVIATGKPELTHIPTQDDCSVCHDVSSIFKPSKFYTNVHVDITRGCEGCHNGQFTTSNGPVAAKAVDHVPSNQDCDVCHTTAVFTPSTFAHLGITSACVSCHDGNYTAVGALGLSPTHIPTSEDCGACHNFANQAFKPAFVDHTSSAVTSVTCVSCHYGSGTGGATGKADKPVGIHVQTSQDCGVCHVPGGSFVPAVFDHNNLPQNTRCDSCHGVSATGKDTKVNPVHVQTTEDCKVCHNTTAFAGAKYNHEGIVDNCASCHGDTAIGKPTYHVPTNDDCSVCHVTTGFIPGTFAHVGIVDNCASCHDGVFATGKNDVINHPATDSDCGVCHSITGQFLDGQMDHTGIVDNCARAGCHGDGATGMDAKTNPSHLSTALDCSACHTTASFVGGIWVHGNDTVNNCLQCHVTGGGAKTIQPPSPGHFDTSVQCDGCHTTDNWVPANEYTHVNGSNYPGDHNSSVVCISCHTDNSQIIDYSLRGRDSNFVGFCASCHAGDFEPKGQHNGGENGTLAQNKDCSGSGCHRVSDREW